MQILGFSGPMFAVNFTVSRSGNTVLVEAGTSVHKTARTKERKTMLLPLVALGHVFRTDKSWGEKWFVVWKQQIAKAKKPYVLPAYSEQQNQWLSRPLTTGEGILWLRDIVQLRCNTGEGLTTHSPEGYTVVLVNYLWGLGFQRTSNPGSSCRYWHGKSFDLWA